YQLRPAADDSTLFRCFSDHESGHILEKKNREPDMITIHHKACVFVGAVLINDATHLDPFRLGAHLQTMTGDDADRTTADSRISCYQSLAVISFVFIERIGVDDSGK